MSLATGYEAYCVKETLIKAFPAVLQSKTARKS